MNKQVKTILKTVFYLSLYSLSNSSFADLNKINSRILKSPKFGKKLYLHPLNNSLNSINFDPHSLLKTKGISFDGAMKKFLYKNLKSPSVNIRSKESFKNNSFGLYNKGNESIEYGFYIQGIPICDYQVKAHKISTGESFLLGQIPTLENAIPTSSDDWPMFSRTFRNTIQYIKSKNVDIEQQKLISKSRCYISNNSNIIPIWSFTVNINGLGYRLYANEDKVYKFENGFFDVLGKVETYERNPIDGIIKTYEVELTGDSTLTSEFFTTNPSGVEKAKEENHEFIYEVSDYRFDEVSVFSHAALTYEFFSGLGYEWLGPKPLELKLHVIINSSKNNALYQPSDATGTGFPTISVGDGDGQILDNLPLDGDVVSHEFGHHIVYKNLKTISGESLILHEALADYFTFARTGDSCLGESICPANSPACWVQNRCLRTADNTIEYKDATYNNLEAHLRGQVVSGMLWDMSTKFDIPSEDVVKIVFKSLDYFVTNSGLYDLILSMLLADRDIMGGKYSCKIYDAAIARGFQDLIANLDCKESSTFGLPTGSNLGAEDGPQVINNGDSSKDGSNPFSCSTINGTLKADQSLIQNFLIGLLLLLPLFLSFFRKRKILSN